ncbi:MAG: hypothetical protein KAU20_00635 [Nanoarchaeota archaeon]|nr:hypothetical protein [Nanoarchaeota archaeon]
MKTKLIGLLTVFLIGVLAVCGIASATITIDKVKVDGDDITDGTNFILGVERGEEFEVKVWLTSDENITEDEVQVEAYLRGYDHDDRAEDITDTFDMKAGVTYVKKLTLKLPQRMDTDNYELRIRAEGRSEGVTQKYTLSVESDRHILDIKDIILSPENSVKAGRALLTSVRIKNYGEKDEEGIKVKVSIPALEISASDYIDEIESDESTTSEELYLRIPGNAETGEYDVNVEVIYDDGDEKISETITITIVAEEATAAVSEEKPTIVYDATAQDVSVSKGAIYAITITNPLSTSKTVTIGVDAVDTFGEARISPSNVMIVGAKETKTVYVYVSAKKEATAGEYGFKVTISGLGTTTQEIPLTANVAEKAGVGGLVRALEVGLIVLVVLLVILGLIIGFNKLKSNEEGEPGDETESQTYY